MQVVHRHRGVRHGGADDGPAHRIQARAAGLASPAGSLRAYAPALPRPEQPGGEARLEPIWLIAGAAVLTLTAATASIGASSPILDRPGVFVTLRTVFCIGTVAVAFAVVVSGSNRRVGAVLLATAATAALGGLTAANDAVPFALGRLAVPIAILLVMLVSFSYPDGHIEDHLARLVMMTATAVLIPLTLANLLLSTVQPVAGPFVRCAGRTCPHNPLVVINAGTSAGHALSTVLALATAIAVFAVAVVVARRAATAAPLLRRSLAPLLGWAVVAALGYAFYVAVRGVDANAKLLTPAAVAVAAVIAAMPFAIALGMGRGRVFAIGALERMVARLDETPTLRGLQRTIARAFGDPTLRLLLWRPGLQQYVGVDGHAADMPTLSDRGQVTEFGHDGEKLAALVHDPVLADDVLEAAGSAITLAVYNSRLQRNLAESIKELDASRKRLATAADEERRRIEQDLHDGAQQGLIGLRIKLQLLQEQAADDPKALAAGLADAGERVDAALEDIRSLAKGIYPSVLRDLGLSYALASAIREFPINVDLHAETGRRFPTEVETAVYFCCHEALQNVAKHCSADARSELTLSEHHDRLQFVLTDDGPGFDTSLATSARGITGMSDRLEAIGGELAISSSPGESTTVTGWVPVRAD